MGNSLNTEQINQLFNPEPGEVYYLKDVEVSMCRDENKIDKNKPRPVLILASKTLVNDKRFPWFNIIPLTTEGTPDQLCFPIEMKYKEVTNGFKPHSNSLALLPYYQPIDKNNFFSLCGKLEDECYAGIVAALSMKVIGYEDYDIEV